MSDDRLTKAAESVILGLELRKNISLNIPYQFGHVNFKDGERAAKKERAKILREVEKALKPFITEPSGSMKACAEDICSRLDYVRPMDVSIRKATVLSALSNHWPDKPELDIDGLFNELSEYLTDLDVEAVMDIYREGADKAKIESQLKHILSRYAKQSQRETIDFGVDTYVESEPFDREKAEKFHAEIESVRSEKQSDHIVNANKGVSAPGLSQIKDLNALARRTLRGDNAHIPDAGEKVGMEECAEALELAFRISGSGYNLHDIKHALSRYWPKEQGIKAGEAGESIAFFLEKQFHDEFPKMQFYSKWRKMSEIIADHLTDIGPLKAQHKELFEAIKMLPEPPESLSDGPSERVMYANESASALKARIAELEELLESSYDYISANDEDHDLIEQIDGILFDSRQAATKPEKGGE